MRTITVVLLNKTGISTEGHRAVAVTAATAGITVAELWAPAGAAESGSEYPALPMRSVELVADPPLSEWP